MPVRMFSRVLAVLTLAMALATVPLHALEQVNDGVPERAPYVAAVRRQFLARDYTGLEKTAEEARAGARFTDGCWKLAVFYNAFIIPKETPDAGWQDWQRRLDQWDQAVPGSITARIARSSARSGRDKLLGSAASPETVAAVREILESTPGADRCPGYYQNMIWVARWQQWPQDQFEKLFAAAIALAPDYETFYFNRAALASRYRSGSLPLGNSWEQFAATTPSLTPPALGQSMYTRVVWSSLGQSVGGAAMENARLNSMSLAEQQALQAKATGKSGVNPLDLMLLGLAMSRAKDGALAVYRVDWTKMKAGFEDLARLYPESIWNKSAYCFYAFCANDRDTTARLMTELNDRYAPGIWGSEAYYNQVKAWALTGKLPAP